MVTEGKSTPRAAVYLRQSLDLTGEGLAVQRQRDDCLRLARERGWEVVGEYVDNSVSAANRRKVRPQYDRLCEDYAAGAFDAVICWDLDRLTRQPRQLEDWIDAAEDRGLRLVTANGEADLSTDGGRMYARVKAAVARAESDRKGARQRAAARQRAENGRPPLGPRLTGYTPKGDLVPAEAEIVASIFSRFDQGDSLRSIAASLTAAAVPARHGDRWSPSSLVTILRNGRYAGHGVYGGVRIEGGGAWPRIVEPDVFDRVQRTLDDPARKLNKSGTDRKYIGSGIYRCGPCGGALISHTGNRYRCPNGCLTRSSASIDALVIGLVRGRLALPDLAELLPSTDDGRVRELVETIDARVARLGEIEADYDSGFIDGRRYQAARSRIDAKLARARVDLAALTGAAGPAGRILRAADPVAEFDNGSLMLRRSVIDMLLTITMHPAPRGSRRFDPATVKTVWKSS